MPEVKLYTQRYKNDKKFPFPDLEVGDFFLEPVRHKDVNMTRIAVNRSIYQWRKTHPAHAFTVRQHVSDDGVLYLAVTRIQDRDVE